MRLPGSTWTDHAGAALTVEHASENVVSVTIRRPLLGTPVIYLGAEEALAVGRHLQAVGEFIKRRAARVVTAAD